MAQTTIEEKQLDDLSTSAIASASKTGSDTTLVTGTTSVLALSAPGTYLFTTYYAADEPANPYFETALISVDGTTRSVVSTLQSGSVVTIGMSNLNVTITQGAGIALVMQ